MDNAIKLAADFLESLAWFIGSAILSSLTFLMIWGGAFVFTIFKWDALMSKPLELGARISGAFLALLAIIEWSVIALIILGIIAVFVSVSARGEKVVNKIGSVSEAICGWFYSEFFSFETLRSITVTALLVLIFPAAALVIAIEQKPESTRDLFCFLTRMTSTLLGMNLSHLWSYLALNIYAVGGGGFGEDLGYAIPLALEVFVQKMTISPTTLHFILDARGWKIADVLQSAQHATLAFFVLHSLFLLGLVISTIWNERTEP